jgi:Ca2+-binding RTX toxin-like protein
MSLEIWLGTQGSGQSVGTPRGIALPNGNTVVFSTAPNFTQRHYTVIDPLGNVVTSGRITLAENLEMVIIDVSLRADGGYDLLFGSNYNALPILHLVRLDAGFTQVSPVQTLAEQFNGFGEMRALGDGSLAILYGTFQAGIQNAGVRFVSADGTVGPVVNASSSFNPGPLFLQVATNDQLVFTAWLDTSAGLARGRLFDLAGNPIGAEFAMSSTGAVGDNRILLERLSDGSFIAVWTQRQNNDTTLPTTLFGRRFSASGQPLGDQFVVSAAVPDGQSITGLAADTDGGFLITFESQTGTRIRLFDASGAPVTDSLAVPGIASEVAIVPIGDGRFITYGSGTSAGFAIIDGRMGNFDGDEGDNLLVGSNAGPSTVNGFGGNDRFFGGSQDDTFNGGAGNDQFTPGEGNNSLVGGTGDDTYFLSTVEFSSATNNIVELAGEGIDTVWALLGFTLQDNIENGGIYASTRPGNLTGNALGNRLTGNDGPNTLSGLGGNDVLLGGGSNDVLLGGEGGDLLDGGDARDRLEGGAGNDQLIGGEGDDVLLPGTGTDRVEGGIGNDEIHFGAAAEASSDDVIDGGTGIDFIVLASGITAFDLSPVTFTGIEGISHFGATLNLTLRTSQFAMLNNFMLGGQVTLTFSDAGAVVLLMPPLPNGLNLIRLSAFGNSVDARALTTFNLAIEGGAGDDVIRLGSARGSASGGDGSDRIFGGNGDDTLDGGDGADVLTGGLDNDTLDGGSNVDTAVVSGLRSAYTVTQTSTGVFQVTGADGTDTLTAVEFLQFDDQILRLRPGTGVSVNFASANPAVYQSAMNAIRDFDGNVLGGDGGWLRIGEADVNGDGDVDQILVNRTIARFATVGTAPDGLVYFNDHGWAGETRVAGIYVDPLVEAGIVEAGSPFDSQRRFLNDLAIENINRVLGANDYNSDGIHEVYFALTDGTAYLRALMHADGNIRYANYQSQQEVIDYLTANGFGPETYAGWFTAPSSAALTMQDSVDTAEANALGRAALRGEDAAMPGSIDPASLVFSAPALDDHLRAEFYG